ncbi:hypothetical protein MFLAVUS_002361 [Mucor flavus]|uniref:Uncharacterized protein n=1 Tax=Mucor flavus TaxID=439312 RepID=A0ABP9YQ17_9FUNG
MSIMEKMKISTLRNEKLPITGDLPACWTCCLRELTLDYQSIGETSSISSRIAIETNKCVFNGENSSPLNTRKIGLIPRYDDTENVELSLNEWKKTKVTTQLKLKQQSKNLRVNACILNNLNGKYCKFYETLALDLIGKFKPQ